MRNLILCYHRVSPLPSGGESKLTVSTKNFGNQIRLLDRFFKFTSLKDIAARPKGGFVSITFDDGYADNPFHAMPILQDFEVPVSFFISTGYPNTKFGYLPDLLSQVFALRVEADLEPLLKKHGFSSTKQLEYWGLHDFIRDLPEGDFWQVLSELSANFMDSVLESDPHRRPMTTSELIELSKLKHVTIGAHTRSHRRLISMDLNSSRGEILGSMADLRALGIDCVDFFAIPYGQPSDFNFQQIEQLGGKIVALSTAPRGFNPMVNAKVLPRICVQDWSGLLLCSIALCAIRFPKIWDFALSLNAGLKRINFFSRKIAGCVKNWNFGGPKTL